MNFLSECLYMMVCLDGLLGWFAWTATSVHIYIQRVTVIYKW